MRQYATILVTFLVAFSAEARITTPSFPELAHHSSAILTGTVLVVLPTPMSPIVLLASVAILASVVFTRTWRKGRRRRAAIAGLLTFLVGVFGAVTLIAFTSFDCYQSVAFVKVERAHRGSVEGIVPVFFRTAFVCDISSMHRGSRYVLFLNPSAVGYQPSWYDWSIWHVSSGRVQTQRLAWDHEQSSSSYEDFVAAIPEALRPESENRAAGNGV